MKTEQFILNDLKNGNFVLTVHAKERLDEREISSQDLVNVALTYKKIEYQLKNDSYKVEGFSLENEPLHVICAYENQTLIITSYYL